MSVLLVTQFEETHFPSGLWFDGVTVGDLSQKSSFGTTAYFLLGGGNKTCAFVFRDFVGLWEQEKSSLVLKLIVKKRIVCSHRQEPDFLCIKKTWFLLSTPLSERNVWTILSGSFEWVTWICGRNGRLCKENWRELKFNLQSFVCFPQLSLKRPVLL